MSTHSGAVAVPADINRPDQLLFGMSGRQVSILAPTALCALLLWQQLSSLVSLPMAVVLTAPLFAIGAAVAFARIDGMGLDKAVWKALSAPRRPLVARSATPDRDFGEAEFATATARGPLEEMAEEGMMKNSQGYSLAVDIGHVNFALRSIDEQSFLVSAMQRMLRTCEARCQIVVASRPVDLSGYIEATETMAGQASSSRLAQCASSHAAWLAHMVRARLLTRQITIVLTTPTREGATWAADQVMAFADSLGVRAFVLNRQNLAERVRAGIDPYGTPQRRCG